MTPPRVASSGSARTNRRTLASWAAAALLLSCVPLRDLDEAVEGERNGIIGHGGRTTSGSGGASAGATSDGARANGGSSPTGTGGEGGGSGSADGEGGSGNAGGEAAPIWGGSTGGGADTTTGGSEGGGLAQGGSATGGIPSEPAEGGTSAAAGSGGESGGTAPIDTSRDAPDLPLDLLESPVTGRFTISSEATWEVDGVQESTFEIHTPTASYWLVKSLGMVVSLVDTHAVEPRQWIDFSPFRPLRGLPSYGSLGNRERMQTTLDPVSQTPTHARFFSTSESGRTRMTWDFYPTHVTITINAAPLPFGFAYRGVPAGLLDDRDRVVFANEKGQSAKLSILADFAAHVPKPGANLPPAEWAYITDEARDRSLFLIQHVDDDIADRYQVKDEDSSLFSFGDGELTTLPQRFSVGIIPHDVFPFVRDRAEFVISAIR
jgi:hypothetical protein